MADVNANIGVNVNTSNALVEIKALQRQLSTLYSSIAKGSASAAAAQRNLETNLLNSINASGKFHAQMGLVRTSTESFTHALEKNKLSMGQYFKYAAGSTKTFGRMFRSEFDTINKVAEERVRKMQTQYIKMGRDASGAMKAMSITPLSLNMKDYETKLAVAAQRQALFNQLMRQGSTNLLNFGKNTQWAGRQLMVGFTVPLMYFGTAASKVFMDLEKQAIKFKRVYGDMFTTSEETNKALGDIQKLAQEFTKYGVAVADTMEMAAKAAAMGKQGADLTAQVAEATRLAVLGGVEQEQALDTTISLTNAFGIAAEDLSKKINFLNAVENQTVLSIEDLTIAVPKAGPVIQQLGGNVEDLAFFMTAMREGGINASEGANALKSGLASLINPSKKASQMLMDMGINLKGIVEANRGDIKGTVIAFSQALDTLAPLERARAIEQLFGKFQFARLSTLFQNVTKDGTQAARTLQLAGASVEELAILSERELKTVEDAVGVNFKEAVEKLKVAIAPIGKFFLETITPIITKIGEWLGKFNDLSDGTKKFIVIATTLLGVIGPTFLMTFGLIANGAANIVKLFLAMRIGFQKLTGSSKILGQNTNYLTTEQLESETVAASLNQVHSRLTQQFTLEAEALGALTAAYGGATSAAQRFLTANPGMATPGSAATRVRRLSQGGSANIVPGTGNTDKVPALLTPGEFVVRKSVAEKNYGLLNAINNGEFQRFFEGGRVFAHALPYTEQAMSDLPERLRFGGGFERANVYTAIGFDVSKESNVNSDLNNNRATARQYLNEVRKPRAILTMTSKLIEQGYAETEARDIARQIQREVVRELRRIPANQIIGDNFVYDLMRNRQNPSQGILPRVAATSPRFAEAIGYLGGAHSASAAASSRLRFNSEVRIDDMIRRIQNSSGTRKGSFIAALQRLQEKLRLEGRPEVVNAAFDRNGNLLGFEREEVSPRSGRYSGKKTVVAYDPNTNVFSGAGRQGGGGGGREIRITRRARESAERVLGISRTRTTARTGRDRSQVVTEQTGQPVPATQRPNTRDRRAIAVSPGEAILTRSSTNALRRGMLARIPGLGRLRLAGAEDGIPQGQTSTLAPVSQAQQRQAAEGLISDPALREKFNNSVDGFANETKTAQERVKEFSGKASVATGAMTTLAIGASFAGGKLGEVAQAALPVLFGLQAITALGPSLTKLFIGPSAPIAVAATALLAIGATIYFSEKRLKEMARKTSDFVDATSATTEKMKTLSEAVGKVGASEIMARRRASFRFNQYTTGGFVNPKFGEKFVQTDIGKQIVESFTQNMKDNGASEAARALSVELASYISDGILTVEQAKSIASQISINLKDMTIASNVSGKLTELLGPNGENILKDPLAVRMKIITESQQLMQNTLSQMIEIYTKALNDPAYAEEHKQEMEKLIAIAGALGAQQIETTQAQIDSLNLKYEKDLKDLEAQKAKAKTLKEQNEIQKKIDALTDKKKKDEETLRLEIEQTLDLQKEAYRVAAKSGRSRVFFESMTEQIKNKYKDDPFVDLLLGKTEGFKDQELRVAVNTMVGAGQLTPQQAYNLMDMMGGDEKDIKVVMDVMPKLGSERIASLINLTTGLSGAKDIMLEMSTKNPQEFDRIASVLQTLKDMGMQPQEIDLAIGKGAQAFANLQKIAKELDKIDKLFKGKKKVTKQLAIQALSTDASGKVDPNMQAALGMLDIWKNFNNLPETTRKNIVLTAQTIQATITDADVSSKIEGKVAAAAPFAKESVRKYWQDPTKKNQIIAEILNERLNALNLLTPPTDDTTTTPTTTDVNSAMQKNISLLDKEIERLQKKADALKKVNDEMKRQNDFMMKQAELSKKQIESKISGDYLGAALIGQQKAFGAADFNAESEQLNIESQIEFLQSISDKLNNKQKLSATEKLSLASLKKTGQATIPSTISNKYPSVAPMAGMVGAYSPQYSLSSGYGFGSVPTSSITNTGGGTVYNSTFNIDVSGVQDPEKAAEIVIKKIQLSSSKNGLAGTKVIP